MPSAAHVNSIMALRARELLKTSKPFMARGSKVKRCVLCLLPLSGCICGERPTPSRGSAFCFIMYWGEAFKPSNTGRLIADVIEDNHAFLWERTKVDTALLQLLADPQYTPVIVFPHQYAEPERCIDSLADIHEYTHAKTPLYIMLDGTWREAKKMFKSPYLAQIPVLGIEPEHKSLYQLREAAHKHQLCTAEVASMVLALGGDMVAANALKAYFEVFRRRYIAGKPHMVLREHELLAELSEDSPF